MSRHDAQTPADYVPALGRLDLLSRWHERIANFMIRRDLLHAEIASHVQLEGAAMAQRRSAAIDPDCADPPRRVSILDIGCGNGQLLMKVNQAFNASDIASTCIGIDRDRRQILRARQIAATTDALDSASTPERPINGDTNDPQPPRFVQACSTSLPLATSSVDIAISCISMHHLDHTERPDSLAEIIRVLRPGGSFALTDCWKPETPPMRALGYLVAIADGFERTRENRLHGLQPALANAGFNEVQIIKRYRTLCGTVAQCVCRLTSQKATFT